MIPPPHSSGNIIMYEFIYIIFIMILCKGVECGTWAFSFFLFTVFISLFPIREYLYFTTHSHRHTHVLKRHWLPNTIKTEEIKIKLLCIVCWKILSSSSLYFYALRLGNLSYMWAMYYHKLISLVESVYFDSSSYNEVNLNWSENCDFDKCQLLKASLKISFL